MKAYLVSDGSVYPKLDMTVEDFEMPVTARAEPLISHPVPYEPIAVPPYDVTFNKIEYLRFPGTTLWLRKDQWKALVPQFSPVWVARSDVSLYDIPIQRSERFQRFYAEWRARLYERMNVFWEPKPVEILVSDEIARVIFVFQEGGTDTVELKAEWWVDAGVGVKSNVSVTVECWKQGRRELIRRFWKSMKDEILKHVLEMA